MLKKFSDGLAKIEIVIAAVLAAVITSLIVLNIVTRALGSPLYWVNELAVHTMVWMTFLATTVLLKRRQGIAVTLLVDALSPRLQAIGKLFVDATVLFFSGFLLWLCWIWFDPLTLLKADFDFNAFQMETFNFIYTERTSTLGLPKFWSWLCMPLFSLSLLVHGLVNIRESIADLAAISRRPV